MWCWGLAAFDCYGGVAARRVGSRAVHLGGGADKGQRTRGAISKQPTQTKSKVAPTPPSSMTSSSSPKHSLATVAGLFVSAMVASFRPCCAFQLGVRLSVRHQPYSLSIAVHHHNTRPYSHLFSTTSDNAEIQKARVVFLGTPDVAAASLKTIYERSQDPSSCYEIVGVVTQPNKRRKKRSGKIIASPVGIVAEELGIPTLTPEKARDPEFLDELQNEVKPDLCITAAYGQYLPKRFLATPKFGTLNIHPSLLPRWRGSSPVQRSLEAGDNPVGVSVLFTVSKMDAGPIVAQESLEIDADEQATTLLPRLFEIGTQLLIDSIPSVTSGEITMDTATVQDESLVAEASMIDSSEGQLWPQKMTAVQCHNRVRGFSMWPGCFLHFQIGDDDTEPVKVKVIKSRVLEEKMEPTDVIEIGQKKGDGLRMVCFDGSVLEMLQVQPATRNVMDAKSFANGLQGRSVRWLNGEDES